MLGNNGLQYWPSDLVPTAGDRPKGEKGKGRKGKGWKLRTHRICSWWIWIYIIIYIYIKKYIYIALHFSSPAQICPAAHCTPEKKQLANSEGLNGLLS